MPKAPITMGTIVIFMFLSFFNSLARSRYLSFFSLSFRFILWPAGTAKSTILQILFFLLLIIIRSVLLAGIRGSVCMLKSHRSLCVSFSWTGVGLCIYNLLVWSNLNFLHISQWITLQTQLCLALYSFSANLLRSLIMWLIVSSLSPHSLHLLFCCVLSIPIFIWLVSIESFSHLRLLFHRSLSDSKPPQVSRTFLSILAKLNNTVVRMVSTRPLISKSFSSGTNSLVTVPKSYNCP